MSKKKESILSRIFKAKKSSCCSMEIIEEPAKGNGEKKEQKKTKKD